VYKKTEIVQRVSKFQQIFLLSKFIKLISGGVFRTCGSYTLTWFLRFAKSVYLWLISYIFCSYTICDTLWGAQPVPPIHPGTDRVRRAPPNFHIWTERHPICVS